MTRFAIIEAGVVANIVEADADFAEMNGWIPAGNASIGDLFDGTTFTPTPAPAPQPPVSVSMRQARLALLEAGLLDDINAAITQLGQAAAIEWEYATEVRRDSPLIALVASNNSLTEQQIDNLFISAAGK